MSDESDVNILQELLSFEKDTEGSEKERPMWLTRLNVSMTTPFNSFQDQTSLVP